MTTSKSLLALPNELLALIIENDDLTIKDLASLRLTCKHTKHFASNALGKRIFVDMDIRYTRDAFNWFTNLLLLDIGSHVRSVCLTLTYHPQKNCYPLKYYRHQEAEIKSGCSRLRDIRIESSHGIAYLWKKVLCAATHLQTFDYKDRDADIVKRHWTVPFRGTIESSDLLLDSIKSDYLGSLVLSHLHISASTLKKLLDIHEETLSTLDIRECVLIDGNWFEILNCIRLNLSHLRNFCIDILYEAVKKVPSPKPYIHDRRPWGLGFFLEHSPYALKKYSSPLKLKIEGQKEITHGLSELLKAREGHQAQ
ncbi:unnamed protein product [Aureobasidium mustum]|uniref:F-box domain-containing protein n=1 Tax=Aureobasidium mustum TaxID=2773714 RepID=A0A9N8PKJ1_9PEZI|nr:unnamed protein product [Aureobasidium mustum]